MLRRQRQRELSEEYKRKQEEQFRFQDLEAIEEILTEDGMLTTATESEGEGDIVQEDSNTNKEAPTTSNKRKKRKFNSSKSSDIEGPLPTECYHLRNSERDVRDELYKTVANLVGVGLSVGEASKSVVLVGNGMFNVGWKEHDEGETIDIDTMPHHRNIFDKLKLIEAQSLSLIVDEMVAQSESGRMITHAIDSTTKKRVGTFACQGIHVGQNVLFPLPLLEICGEKTRRYCIADGLRI